MYVREGSCVFIGQTVFTSLFQTVPLTLDSIDLVVDLVLENIVSNNKLVKRHKNLLLISLYSPKERYEYCFLS